MNETPGDAHGGDSRAVAAALKFDTIPDVRLDFSVNLNPLGPPPAVRMLLWREMRSIAVYPDAAAAAVEAKLAHAHGLAPESVVAGNGSTELFGLLLQALAPRRVGWVAPCYGGYAEACRALGVPGEASALTDPDDDFLLRAEHLALDGVDLLFVGSPNNPTGKAMARELMLDAAARQPRCCFVADESFMDFLPDPSGRTLIRAGMPQNLIVVKSLTKFFAIPGLRLGMACGAPDVMARLRAARLPWSVNALAQAAAGVLYEDREYLERSRSATAELREAFAGELSALPGWTVYPADANFLLVRLPAEWPASRLQRELLRAGILIRSCAHFHGLGDRYCRLAVRPRDETGAFMEAVRSLVQPGRATAANPPRRRRTPAIMVVGTMSNAGKSAIAAGLCRLFARRGYAVAPFKAQNMALNSFVTKEGGEMGRAQVVQARAAGVPPHTDMNPVLLKPLGEKGSQVIVNGHAIGNFTAREYYAMKSRMREAAHAAYDRLAERHELIVMEGAGSPAEINLQAEDFVNMDMAAYAGATAILVADIDRGGVFASILGTVHLLLPAHRPLLKGIVINKFRGDVTLLESGIRDIEAMTGVPVLGVLPYLRDLRIEAEDSLYLDSRPAEADGPAATLHVAVIRLPRISNFTDFLALERTPGVRITYPVKPEDLGPADLIVIPGSKNTRADLRHLRDSGWETALADARRKGVPLFGICGGYQMLGRTVADPHGAEGTPGEERGLGFLAVTTTLESEKELAQVAGVTRASLPFASPGTGFEGYEIHAGHTRSEEAETPLDIVRRRGAAVVEQAGAVSRDGLVFGCYVHGFLDAAAIRTQLLEWLCRRKGIPVPAGAFAPTGPADEFDRLADTIEEHIDLTPLEAAIARAG